MQRGGIEYITEVFRRFEALEDFEFASAAQEFYKKKQTPTRDEKTIFMVFDRVDQKTVFVAALTGWYQAEKLGELLDDSLILQVELDAYASDIARGCKLYDVDLDENGQLLSVKKSTRFLLGEHEYYRQYFDDEIKDRSGSTFKIGEASYFAMSEREAVVKAKKTFVENFYFQELSEDDPSEPVVFKDPNQLSLDFKQNLGQQED